MMDMASPASDGAPQLSGSSSRRDSFIAMKIQNATKLTRRELEKITNNFCDERKIGTGGCGTIYKGVHDNGDEIAVKLLHNNNTETDEEQFRCEFANVTRLEHHNIVRLVGYCHETQHIPYLIKGELVFVDKIFRALCFEYMRNGSLQKHLSDEFHGLDWHTRYKIIKGTCEGLKYLHEGFKEPIYHLDLKPDNILLDEDMIPKLADFGLSKLFGGEQTMITQSRLGTFGYLPQEYLLKGIVSKKLDIFSLGVVMTQIIAGPKGHTRSDEMPYQEFLDQVQENWRNRFEAAWSPSVPLEAYCPQVNICAEIALSCMEVDRQKRPSIVDIIHKLNETELVIDKALSLLASPHPLMPGDGPNLVKLQAFARSRTIPGTDTCNKFPLLVQVTASPRCSMEKMLRAGVDIVAVIDISKSMSGYRMECTKRAMITVINKLDPNDRLSIVSFETHAHRLTELTYMSNKGRQDARFQIYELKALNGSDMGAALQEGEGAEILQGREAEESSSRVGCMMFLSASHYGEEIYEQQISPDFAVHTFGLGAEHNPRVMKDIADKTSGTYSFVIQDIEKIKDAFELFINGLTCVARHIKIILRANEGVAISSIESRGYSIYVGKDIGVIEMDSIYASDQKNFIVYLTVSERKEKLVTIGCQYQSLDGSKLLADTNVSVVRPSWACSPHELSIHHEVAAELVRIRLEKEVSAITQQAYGCMCYYYLISRMVYFSDNKLRELWDRIKDFDEGHAAPNKTLSDLDEDIAEMRRDIKFFADYKMSGLPYMLSWLTCHKWQRATMKGTPSKSGAFQSPNNR